MKLSRYWLGLIAFIFFFLLAAIYLLSRPDFYAGEKAHSQQGMNLARFLGNQNFGGSFTLVDHNNEPMSSSEYSDMYKLIYFGFTYCPHVCPLTLKKIAGALDHLDEEQAGKIQPVFITVDPERDTPDILKHYVTQFHPRMAGLTGTRPQLEKVWERYRVFAQKIQSETATGYQVDHTSFIYLTGPDDAVIGVFMTTHSPEEMAASIRKVLE